MVQYTGNVSLVAWLAAPVPWIAQDYTRFPFRRGQCWPSSRAWNFESLRDRLAPRFRAAFAGGLVTLATWSERKQLAG